MTQTTNVFPFQISSVLFREEITCHYGGLHCSLSRFGLVSETRPGNQKSSPPTPILHTVSFCLWILKMMAWKRYVLANLWLVLVSVLLNFMGTNPDHGNESELWCLPQLREKEIDSTPHMGQTWSPHLLHIMKHMQIPVWRHIFFQNAQLVAIKSSLSAL